MMHPSDRASRLTGFTSDGQIYYEIAGKRGSDALVFCHGMGGNHASWYQQVPEFALDYRVVVWDQRGFGRSRAPTDDVGPVKAVYDLARLLAEIHVDRAHLVGQSMGGWAALGFAIQNPHAALSLTLSATIGGIFTPETEAAFDRALQRAAQPAPDAFVGLHPALGPRITREDPTKAYLYQQISSFGSPAFAELVADLRSTSYPLEAVRALDVPALFIVGSDDPIFPRESVRRAAAELQRSRVVEIADAGHSPYFESPAEWNDALRQFLNEVAAESER